MIIGDFSDMESDDDQPNIIKLKRCEMEFLCGYRFENDKIWEMFSSNFMSDFLIKNKILIEAYGKQIQFDYIDTISRFEEED